jgi:repressor LexA
MTERQEAVLNFIREEQRRRGIPPSQAEIQEHFRFRARNSAYCHLRALANKGLVKQLDGHRWGVAVSEVQEKLFELPVYGTIPAGRPEERSQEALGTIGINPKDFGVTNLRDLWGLEVSGDSMVGAHILSGDVAVMARREPQPGDIIAALVDDAAVTLKRYARLRGRPVLRAENPRYPDVFPQRLECQGVMVGLVRRSR